jgi:DNA repair exonuclease SbcCD ATPase subunit
LEVSYGIKEGKDLIIFKKISAKNFLSFEEFEFDFKSGKHLIAGTNHSTNFAESNGSGKSSLFEGISWCIYKKTIRDKNISKDGKGKCQVSLNFSIEDDDYIITRSTDKSDKKDTVRISCNGENISPRNTENIEDVIDKIIGIPYDLFVIVVTVLQGLPVNLSTMTPTIRKGVLEAMMGLDNWDVINKLFQKEKSIISEEYREINNQYSLTEDKMIAKNAVIETIKTVTGKDQVNFTEELRQVKKQLSEARSNINSLENRREMCSTENSDVISKELNTLKSSCTIVKNQINDLIDLTEDKICPTCGQDYPLSMIEKAKEKLATFDEKLPMLQAKVRDVESLLSNINLMDNEIYTAKREMRILQSNLDNIISRMDNQKEDNTESISDLKEELKILTEEVNELNRQLKNIEIKQEGTNYILSLLLPSSPFRTRILERYLGYINNILAEISPSILDDMIISLEVDKKANGIEIQINEGKRGYRSFSGGEKRRMDIIIILSLQKFLLECTGVSTNLLVFDEIFDSLDSVGIQMVLNSIDMVFNESLCVYVITHKSDFRQSFESIIEVEKIDGVSRIRL